MPLPMIMAGANLAIGVAQSIIGDDAADDQRDAEKERAALAALAARKAYKFELGDIAMRENEETLSAAVKSNQRLLQSLKEKSLARVAAAESGVSGLSVDRILDDIGQQAGKDQAIISRQLTSTKAQLDRSRDRAKTNMKNRIAGVSTIQSPGSNSTATGLNILSTALNSYTLYNQLKP